RWIQFYPQRFPCVFYDAEEKTGIYHVVSPPGFEDGYEKYIAASEHANAGRYSQAFRGVNECLAIYPGLGCATNLLGSLFYLGKNWGKAEESFLKAVELAPDSSIILLNLATLYHHRGDKDRTTEYLQKGFDVSKASYNEKEFQENYQKLQGLWN